MAAKIMADARLERFGQLLQARQAALRREIAESLAATRSEGYAVLAGQVHDRGDESLADLLVGVNYSGVERDLQEARDVEAALQRLHQGTFGTCIDCGAGIPVDRLLAYPTAKRCGGCQRKHENAARKPPSL